MIQIRDLKAGVGDTQILNGVSLDFELGKNYCLLGKNGSGKSSLSAVLMGNPQYQVTEGSVDIVSDQETQDLLSLSPEQRSAAGLFLSFQHVPEISGIVLSEYLRTIYNTALKQKDPDQKDISPFIFQRFVKQHLDELGIDPALLQRDLNVGFSGGEKRKIEILQMKLIGPSYIILDEIDSGLDLDAFRKVAELLASLDSKHNTLIIITHYFKILDYISVDEVVVLENGKIAKQGGNDLITEIQQNGFQ